MAAQAQQVMSDIATGDPMHAMMQSLGGYQQSVQKEQTDPDIVAAQKKSADVSKEAQATVDQTGKNIEQEGVDLANATKPWNADQEMAKYSTPAIKAFGSAGSVFAILASAFTHQPMINALNGSAAAMNAIRAGDADAYNKAYDAYKENTDLALKRHEMMMDDFKSVVDLSKTRMDLASAALTQLQAKYGDQQTAKLAELGAWDKIGELWNSREQTAIQLKEAQSKLVPYDIFSEGLKEFQGKNGRKPTAQEMGQIWQQTQSMATVASIPPGDLKDMADQYLAGDKSVLQGLGYGNTGAANRAMLRHYIQAEARDKGMSGQDVATKIAEFSGLVSAERSVGTRTATVEMAVSELNRVMPLAIQASKAVNRGRFVPFTQAQQAVQRGTSDPALAQFVAANNTLINVYARAISPSGVPTVSDKDHAREMISTAQSQDAYQAVVTQMMKEAEAAEQAPGDVKQDLRNLADDGSNTGQNTSTVALPESAQDYSLLPSGSKYRKPGDPPGSWRTKP